MEEQPEAPIIVFADGDADVDVFPDVRAALASVEAIDVENGEYEFYDGRGHPLHAVTREWTVTGLHRVDGGHADPDALCVRLRRQIARIGVDRVGLPSVDTADLTELADALLRFEARFQAEHSLGPAAVLRRLIRRRTDHRTSPR